MCPFSPDTDPLSPSVLLRSGGTHLFNCDWVRTKGWPESHQHWRPTLSLLLSFSCLQRLCNPLITLPHIKSYKLITNDWGHARNKYKINIIDLILSALKWKRQSERKESGRERNLTQSARSYSSVSLALNLGKLKDKCQVCEQEMGVTIKHAMMEDRKEKGKNGTCNWG